MTLFEKRRSNCWMTLRLLVFTAPVSFYVMPRVMLPFTLCYVKNNLLVMISYFKGSTIAHLSISDISFVIGSVNILGSEMKIDNL